MSFFVNGPKKTNAYLIEVLKDIIIHTQKASSTVSSTLCYLNVIQYHNNNYYNFTYDPSGLKKGFGNVKGLGGGGGRYLHFN